MVGTELPRPSPVRLNRKGASDTGTWTDEELAKHLELVSKHFIDLLDSRLVSLTRAREDSWSDVHESNFNANLKVLPLTPQSENFERIDFLIAYGSAPGGGMMLIELGGYDAIPIVNGTLAALSGKWRLNNTDVRILSSVTQNAGIPGLRGSGQAGYLYLALFGKEIPAQEWRW